MIINVYTSLSATKKQNSNAKVLFGSKGQSILSSLEAASKVKVLDTPAIDTILQWLKASDAAAVEKFASSASGKKLSQSCAAFAKNKTFEGKLNALKAIKFKVPSAKKPASGKNPTLDVRGPFKVELDFVLSVDSNGGIHLQDAETKAVYNALKALNIGLHVIELDGPGGGNPLIELHGTKKALTTFLKAHYIPGMEVEDAQELLSSIEPHR